MLPCKTTHSANTQPLFVVAFLITAIAAVHSPASAQSEAANLFAGWKLSGDARLVGTSNSGLLHIDTGTAESPIIPFANGTIEFEVQPSGHRAFVYLYFRTHDPAHHEEIYLRTHKSNSPDALQYAPVIAGSSQWQLYWGASGTAAVSLPAETWTKVRVEFEGRKLAVFVGQDEQPAMTIARLALEPRAGGFTLRSFIPRGSQAPFGARFRNVRSTPKTNFDFSQIQNIPKADPLVVRNWQATAPFGAEQKNVTELPSVEASAWLPVATEPDGLALLHRLGKADGARLNATVVKLDINAVKAETRSLDLGFSDAVSVFLNGQPIVSLDASYRFSRPRLQGLIGLHQTRIHLPLQQGNNELRIVVTDSFGGWGIMGRWVIPTE